MRKKTKTPLLDQHLAAELLTRHGFEMKCLPNGITEMSTTDPDTGRTDTVIFDNIEDLREFAIEHANDTKREIADTLLEGEPKWFRP